MQTPLVFLFPNCISELVEMRSLRLSGKKLQNLPDLSKMTKLQVINFEDYPMSVLPFSSFLPFGNQIKIDIQN